MNELRFGLANVNPRLIVKGMLIVLKEFKQSYSVIEFSLDLKLLKWVSWVGILENAVIAFLMKLCTMHVNCLFYKAFSWPTAHTCSTI